LNEQEIQRMVKEAEANKAADTKRRELSEAKNQAESLVYETEQNIDQFKTFLSDEDKETLKNATSDLKSKLADGSTDSESIKSAAEEMKKMSMKIFETAYNKKAAATGSAPDASGGSASGSGKPEDNVQDAEYKDVNDKK